VNLASDVPGLARVIDPNLVNPWGIAFSPTGPLWFADNGSGVSDLLDGRGQAFPLVVKVPSAARLGSTPTGTVFNGGAGFAISENGVTAASRFLFATEDGTLSGWNALVDPTRALLEVDNSSAGAVYKGLALATDPLGHSLLYAADFGRGKIDVFDQDFRPVTTTGSFLDPTLPAGYAPFNIQNIDNQLFVTYAQQDDNRHDDVPGAGHGFIDAFDTDGRLVRRFASQGALDSPWALSLAPADFGPAGGALLVGNNGDGRINAYDPTSGAFLGQLEDDSGSPITIPDLWGLTFGNGHAGGDANTLFFVAGVGDEQHGLFGTIQAPGRRGADTAGPGTFDPKAPGETGDYPLPPTAGPALQPMSKDSPILIVDLLPLQESSLVLAPTLSTISQSGAGVTPLFPTTSMVRSFASQPVFATLSASNFVTIIPADGNPYPANGSDNGSTGLNRFLDVSPSQNVRQMAGVERRGTDQGAVDTRGLSSSDRRPESESNENQQPDVPAPSGRMIALPTSSYSEREIGSAHEWQVSKGYVESKNGSGWSRLIQLVFILSIPTSVAAWAAYRTTIRFRAYRLTALMNAARFAASRLVHRFPGPPGLPFVNRLFSSCPLAAALWSAPLQTGLYFTRPGMRHRRTPGS
jgi:uncharacterized protein (TIGR03118 family)